MQNSERQPFDKSWKSAFDGAEMAPPDRLWRSIEAELAGGESATMKKRVVFYQRLAAATVLFAMLTGAYAIYNYNNAPAEFALKTVVPTTPKTETPRAGAVTVAPKASVPDANATDITKQADISSPRIAVSKGKGNSSTTMGNPTDSAPPIGPPGESNSGIAENQGHQSRFEEVREPETFIALDNPAQQNTGIVAQDQKESETEVAKILTADEINALAEEQAKKEKSGFERTPWLGVGAAAGSFTPSAVVADGGFAMDAMDPNYSPSPAARPQSQSESVGSAYSAGVSAGMRLSKRWILQSGLNYINQQVDYSTNFVGVSSGNRATAMTKEYMSTTSMSVTVTNPYEVSSATEILSVPIQAGYLIIDRKIGWQVSSGVSTDFLLRNTLTDKSGIRSTVTEGAGEDSPYRAVNWAAMLTTEVSYQLGDHYRLALVPGMRYSFQPLLKERSTGTPLILDIGFRFKYLFK
jgi:hypothetical protein